MELNDLFITITLINSVWILLNRLDRAWSIKAALLLGLLAVAWKYHPDQAGLIAAGPWAVLILAPMWLQHWTVRLIHQRHLRAARVATVILAILHPWSGSRNLRQTVQILMMLLRGDVSAGLQLASQYQLRDPALTNLGTVLELQRTGDWKSFEHQMSTRIDRGIEDASLLAGRLLATAQLGQWAEFANLCESVAQGTFSQEQLTGLELRAWALLGDLPAVHSVLRASGHLQARENREFWLAVAEQMQGQVKSGQQRLIELRDRASPVLSAMIQRQLDGENLSSPDWETEGCRARLALQPLRLAAECDARFSVLSGLGRFPLGTIAISLILIVVFLFEIPGGSENSENLERLGALVVPVRDGDWLSRLTCGFLHFGPIHLVMNLLGLWILGRAIERGLGRIGLLLHFLICLAISGLLLPTFTFLPPGETAIFAGASGGIMGLLGGIFGNLAVGRFTAPTPRIRQQFQAACSLIGLQATCDFLTPNVSMTCHMLGLVTGILLGLVEGAVQIRSARSACNDSSQLLPNRDT